MMHSKDRSVRQKVLAGARPEPHALHRRWSVGAMWVVALVSLAWSSALEAQVREPDPSARSDQLQNTLDLEPLLARVGALEAEVRELRATGDSARREVAELGDSLTREQRMRAVALDELRQSLLSRIDSEAEVTANLQELFEGEVASLRLEGERGHSALSNRLDDAGRELDAIGSRVARWKEQVSDSLVAVEGRVQDEQGERQAGDRRNALLAATGAGLLLVALGISWWNGRRGLAALVGKVRGIEPNVAEFVEAARQGLAADVRRESWQVLREQLGPLEEISSILGSIQAVKSSSTEGRQELDHDLPLAVSNEVNRIEKNLGAMNPSIRGHKKLVACVRRVKENMHVHGYVMTELLGKPYDDGMDMRVDEFIPDDRLAAGERVITRINQPEVRHRGRIVRNASIRVSVGF